MENNISSLNVSASKKQELEWVKQNVKFVSPLGSVTFDSNSNSNRLKKTWILWSMWAFFFTCFPYFFTGMWRKGLSILTILVVGSVTAVFLEESFAEAQFVVRIFAAIIQFGVPAVLALSYKWDSYRHLVKKEVFWW